MATDLTPSVVCSRVMRPWTKNVVASISLTCWSCETHMAGAMSNTTVMLPVKHVKQCCKIIIIIIIIL